MKVSVKYRIYQCYESETANGFVLDQPRVQGYGHLEIKYDDFDSLEEAARMLEKIEDYNEYIILPVTSTSN